MPSRRRLTEAELTRAKTLARRLKTTNDPANAPALSELADIFASAAVGLVSPAKSFAKRIPYHLGKLLNEGQLAAIIQAANERVADLRSANRTIVPLQRFLTIEEVAPLFGLTVSVMEKMLIEPEFRRSCGWPQWVQGRWFFHPDAFGPRKPEYFGCLPEKEPYPPPPHCLPQIPSCPAP